MASRAPVVFGLAGLGGLLVWSGVTDPVGGPIGAVAAFVQGRKVARRTHVPSGLPGEPISGFAGPAFGVGTKLAGQLANPPNGPSPGGGSGFGAEVVRTAQSYLGAPYRWGGTDPWGGGVDCSGLTQLVYRQCGVALPRVSAMQAAKGHAVAAPSPGDLVFYGHPVHHVAIAVGGTMILHAPHSGAVVRYESIQGAALRTDPPPFYRTYH